MNALRKKKPELALEFRYWRQECNGDSCFGRWFQFIPVVKILQLAGRMGD
jgi:hypothetical protein